MCRRNGLSVQNQSFNYRRRPFSLYCFELDLLALQQSSMLLGPITTVAVLADRFNVLLLAADNHELSLELLLLIIVMVRELPMELRDVSLCKCI